MFQDLNPAHIQWLAFDFAIGVLSPQFFAF